MALRRGLGEAVHLGFRVFLAVLGVLHHVGESHHRLVGATHRVQRGIHRQLVALGLVADVSLPLGADTGVVGASNVIAEHRPRVGVGLLDGRAGDRREAGPPDRDNAPRWVKPNRAAEARKSTR